MSAAADEVLTSLRNQGLHLSVATDGRLLVAPKAAITPAHEVQIRAHKLALLVALAAEARDFEGLERRVRAMAERWSYTAEDLAWALEDARRNPAGWRMCCEADEELAAKLQRAGMQFGRGGKNS